MGRRIIAISMLQRLDAVATSVLRFVQLGSICRDELIAISLVEGVYPVRKLARRTASRGVGRVSLCYHHYSPHGWHTLDIECKGVFVHRGIKTVGREPSWCRPNSEYHKALAPFLFPVKGASK